MEGGSIPGWLAASAELLLVTVAILMEGGSFPGELTALAKC